VVSSPIFYTFFRFSTTEAGVSLTVPPDPVTRETTKVARSSFLPLGQPKLAACLSLDLVAIARQFGQLANHTD
jgi:hypothetical protein